MHAKTFIVITYYLYEICNVGVLNMEAECDFTCGYEGCSVGYGYPIGGYGGCNMGVLNMKAQRDLIDGYGDCILGCVCVRDTLGYWL